MALQIVTEKPQPPAWESIGFDEQLAATVYRHKETGETVGWSLRVPTTSETSTYRKTKKRHAERRVFKEIGLNSVAHRVLEAVCDGLERAADIDQRIGGSNPSGYLRELARLGYIKRHIPDGKRRPRYRPTDKGIEEYKRLSRASARTELQLTRNQETVLKAIAAGVDTTGRIISGYGISPCSIHCILEALLRRKLITKTIIHRTLSKYTATDASRVIAKALR